MISTPDERRHQAAFLVALAGSALPFAITFHIIDRTVERNPVTGVLLDVVGWVAVGLAVPVVTVAAFMVFDRVREWGYHRTAAAGMYSLSVIGVINTLNDIYVGSKLGVNLLRPFMLAVMLTGLGIGLMFTIDAISQHRNIKDNAQTGGK